MAPTAAFVEVFKRRGVAVTVAEARVPMGLHKRDHIRALTKLPAVAARWRKAQGRPCVEADVEAMFAEFVPLQLSVLTRHSDLIPGALEGVREFRRRGLKIGTTTGYTGEMMALLKAEAKKRGYEPDSTVCATDVPAGRPQPWMALQNALNLGVFPMSAVVKIGDTVADIEEGLNAGMWTIGLARTGNELGLPLADAEALPKAELRRRLAAAYKRLKLAGAHYVVDGLSDCPAVVRKIDARLARGERP
jgi:phosphonoacetaldehyde hydrolase